MMVGVSDILAELSMGVLGRPQPQWGRRADGGMKGRGWLGVIPTGNGDEVMTELSTMMTPQNGPPFNMPLIVPTLTRDEIEKLKNRDITREIFKKALDHALRRMNMGYSPYYD